MQGFLFSKPLPKQGIGRLLKKHGMRTTVAASKVA
jgi:hypothetical protein